MYRIFILAGEEVAGRHRERPRSDEGRRDGEGPENEGNRGNSRRELRFWRKKNKTGLQHKLTIKFGIRVILNISENLKQFCLRCEHCFYTIF